MAVPNQKTIVIKKAPADKNNIYTIINIEALENAVKTLGGETLKLWLYFAKNQNDYVMELSRQDCINFGIGSESSYKRAVAELINKGYLQNIKGNTYHFNEYVKQ